MVANCPGGGSGMVCEVPDGLGMVFDGLGMVFDDPQR